LDHKGGELVRNFFVVGHTFENFIKKEGEACTMDGKKSSNWKLWHVMGFRHNECAPIVGWK